MFSTAPLVETIWNRACPFMDSLRTWVPAPTPTIQEPPGGPDPNWMFASPAEAAAGIASARANARIHLPRSFMVRLLFHESRVSERLPAAEGHPRRRRRVSCDAGGERKPSAGSDRRRRSGCGQGRAAPG